jgi:hypothetical protein
MNLRIRLEHTSRHALPLRRWQAGFVLEHGRRFTPRVLSPCTYRLSDSTPIQHAWLATPDGVAVDLTWTGGPKRPEFGREYFGVPLKT